jgi:hypothetical protein
MAVVKPLVKEITHYLGNLNTSQQQAVLAVVKTFAQEDDTILTDKNFLSEIDRRFAEMESGRVTARKNYKNRKK